MASISTSTFKSGAVPLRPIFHHHRQGTSPKSQRFFRVVRVSLSGLVDSSAFQEVSLGREVSIVFTSTGPLIYQWEANNSELRETTGR